MALSPRFVEAARAQVMRLIVRHGELEGLLAAEATQKTLGPVSYTHLDVYKRQILDKVRIMPKVTSKLQLTVPKKIADQYGIRSGDELEWIRCV